MRGFSATGLVVIVSLANPVGIALAQSDNPRLQNQKISSRAVKAPSTLPSTSGNTRTQYIKVYANKSSLHQFATPVSQVLVGSTDIADVVTLNDRQIYILGKKPGTTNVTVFDTNQKLIAILDIEVKSDHASTERDIRASSGGNRVRLRANNDKVVVSGFVPDGRAASLAMRAAPKDAINALQVMRNQQVMVRVRIVEASRTATKALGIRWDLFRGRNGGQIASIGTQTSTSKLLGPLDPTGSPLGSTVSNVVGTASGGSPFATILGTLINGSNGRLDVVLSALEERGVLRRLAEPNLIAMSGQSAEFLAGGEFPVPVGVTSATGIPNVTIQYKEFGVKLTFTPTVLSNGVIHLALQPEVSELDPSNGVQLVGVRVPGIVKRRARTMVELRDGQTFAIAGLLQSQSQNVISQFPWLGTLPVIGALFRSSEFQRKETELVVLVTPHLVKPTRPGQRLKTPHTATITPSDVDQFLRGHLEVPRAPKPVPQTPTAARTVLNHNYQPVQPFQDTIPGRPPSRPFGTFAPAEPGRYPSEGEDKW